jgi:hypothetical protein
MIGQSVTKKLSVPIRHADLLWRCGNSIPKRLNVLDLLLDRQFIELRWWDGQCLSHIRETTSNRLTSQSASHPSRDHRAAEHANGLPMSHAFLSRRSQSAG